jgi:signal transduction histidine kinase
MLASMDGEAAPMTRPRRWTLPALVMVGIALLHLGAEYFGTHDIIRLVSKAAGLVVGLPVLVFGSFAVFRWSSRRGLGLIGPAFGCAVAFGVLFGALLLATRAATVSVWPTFLQQDPWRTGDVLRVGFAMGLTYFGLWALAFLLPTVTEDARFKALEADKFKTQAELAQLRSSLEPHFLLNTLNTVASFVTEDPQKACQLLGTLGDLLRESVNVTSEMQTFGEQLEWLRRYAQILEERHGRHLAFHWDIHDGTSAALLPRLLLQPLLENAVKHGALMRQGGGEITVKAEIVGDRRLVFTVQDNGPGVPKEGVRPGAFGLVSVRRRLALRYADAAALRLESSAAGTRSIVEVPLEQGGRPA